MTFMLQVAGDPAARGQVRRRRSVTDTPCLRFSSGTVWRSYGREIAERQGEPSLGGSWRLGGLGRDAPTSDGVML
jgi:hypothetical protein